MATKKQLSEAIEGLAEQLAEQHGATIAEKTIKVGGRETKSRVAEGGVFDLDAARGILMAALRQHKDKLVQFMPTRPAGANGPRVGPDGQVHVGAAEELAAARNGHS
jgi:hypothetical protein